MSEHITTIPSGMVCNTYTNEGFTKIYVDFSKITRIDQAGFNPSNQSNGNSPQTNPFYFYDAKAFIENGTDVLVTNPDFSNCTYIGQAAFQGANFKKVVIPDGCELSTSGQMFRSSTIEELEVLGTTTRATIGTYSFQGCPNLKKIKIESPVTTYESSVFTSNTALTEFYIDLSKTVTVRNQAFNFTGDYDGGCTTVQWYNLKGEKMVDLSSMEYITGGNGAFSSSNIGSAEKIVWPKALKQLDDQAFRKCNISVPMYFNAAESFTLSVGSYVMDGNTPPIVVLGEGITTYNGGIKNTVVISLADSTAFGDTARDASGRNNATGTTIYYKATESDLSKAKFTSVIISDATVQTFKGCGLVATATPVGGDTLTFNYYEHKYNNAPDMTACPVGSVTIFTCIGCGDSYKVTDEETFVAYAHEYKFENGAVLVGLVYENDNYLLGGTMTVKCAHCDSTTVPEEKYDALFEAVGYSMSEDDEPIKYVSHTVIVNKKAIEVYETISGKTVNYGVVGAIANDGKPLYLDNEGKVTPAEKAVAVNMTGTDYSKITIKINGLSAGIGVNCNAYVLVDGAISYICDDQILDVAVEKIIAVVEEPKE